VPAAGPYPPIGDYALIGDCHSAALVSRRGSVDWCCMPRFDSGSNFGRILDWDKGGFCSIEPTRRSAEPLRSYLDGTLVLATTFRTAGGEAVLYDCFTMRRGGAGNPRRQLLRIVEGAQGRVEMRVHIVPRFDYGELSPWIRHHGPRHYSAIGGDDALMIWSDAELVPEDDHGLEAVFIVRPGERVRLSLVWIEPERIDPEPPRPPTAEELDQRFDETVNWWRRWSSDARLDGPDGPAARRSAIVLKALTNAPTGAVAAAPTTSLPEAIGAGRNWDYRYSWIRDSQFTVRSLGELGFEAEADGFRRFIERSAASSAENLQIMYGVGGERRLVEIELPHLEGYRRSAPVRVGNAAARQLQLDAYGEVLDLSWQWHQRGRSPDDDYWRFLVSVVDTAATRWSQPDRGIWEMRGKARHFVHSKAMCWVALDRGLRLAEESMRRAPAGRWRKARDEIRAAVETKGYEKKRGVFVQSFGSQHLDAALLLLPQFEFIAYDDERMLRTTDAIVEELDDGGLIRRYRASDSLDGDEGVFVACSFWLAECLARQGRLEQARRVFDKAIATSNDLGLFSEEFDVVNRQQLGNFPQGLTHLSHIAAAVALVQETSRRAGLSP
jgi:GH15 family glucan-1,4-alpha-glucosidase